MAPWNINLIYENGIFATLCTCVARIMHNTAIIVWNIISLAIFSSKFTEVVVIYIISYKNTIILSKIKIIEKMSPSTLKFWLQCASIDANVIIPIWSDEFMIKSQRMHHFMHWRSNCHQAFRSLKINEIVLIV